MTADPGARQLADRAGVANGLPRYAGGRQSQISGYYDPIPTPDSPSGWVYIVANNFNRSSPVVLYRGHAADVHRPVEVAGLVRSGHGGGWGKPPTPLWPDMVGEMSVRQIDGKSGAVLLQLPAPATWRSGWPTTRRRSAPRR